MISLLNFVAGYSPNDDWNIKALIDQKVCYDNNLGSK